MNLRETIVARRKARIDREGASLGLKVPAVRRVPVVSFPASPGLICEVKRRSPSRGDIDRTIDIVEHIRRYVNGGARSVSVLTEEDYFHGSLADLVVAKARFPEVSFLRKDFLINEEDIEVSYRAGADAVLLIASILDESTLVRLIDRSVALGMTPLVEVHTQAEIEALRVYRPPCVGCNARDLASFEIDLLTPLSLKEHIDWPCATIFESGVWRAEDATLAASGGFDAVLVGEAVVRSPDIVPSLIDGFETGEAVRTATTRGGGFWRRIASRASRRGDKPLVKICGLTRPEDIRAAAELGADILGFVFADSPRRASAEVVASTKADGPLRVAVVVAGNGLRLPREVEELVAAGHLDAVQFHGDELPDECHEMAFPYYKALRLRRSADLDRAGEYHAPRTLLDAFSPRARGGTGARIEATLVASARTRGPLWLAGGLAPDNVREVVEAYRPELIDASSRLEAGAGRKDHTLLKRFFDEIRRAEVRR